MWSPLSEKICKTILFLNCFFRERYTTNGRMDRSRDRRRDRSRERSYDREDDRWRNRSSYRRRDDREHNRSNNYRWVLQSYSYFSFPSHMLITTATMFILFLVNRATPKKHILKMLLVLCLKHIACVHIPLKQITLEVLGMIWTYHACSTEDTILQDFRDILRGLFTWLWLVGHIK